MRRRPPGTRVTLLRECWPVEAGERPLGEPVVQNDALWKGTTTRGRALSAIEMVRSAGYNIIELLRLVLIRHGEPQASLDGVVAGPRGCRGLSDLGRQQVKALCERLLRSGELAGAVVYTSVPARAVESAAILAPALGEAVQDCELCELHPGECDGSPWSQWGSSYPSWEDPAAVFSRGGESLVSFDLRVRKALGELQKHRHGQTVVVVGHSGFIEAATLAFMRGQGFPEVRPFMINALRYTSLTEWCRLSDDRWLLERYNDAGHLAGMPLAAPQGLFR